MRKLTCSRRAGPLPALAGRRRRQGHYALTGVVLPLKLARLEVIAVVIQPVNYKGSADDPEF